MKGYVCKNCGFKFREPKVIYRGVPLNPGALVAIHPSVLYYSIEVCPNCGSDLIQEIMVP